MLAEQEADGAAAGESIGAAQDSTYDVVPTKDTAHEQPAPESPTILEAPPGFEMSEPPAAPRRRLLRVYNTDYTS